MKLLQYGLYVLMSLMLLCLLGIGVQGLHWVAADHSLFVQERLVLGVVFGSVILGSIATLVECVQSILDVRRGE